MEQPKNSLKRAGWTPAIVVAAVGLLIGGRVVLRLWDDGPTEPPPTSTVPAEAVSPVSEEASPGEATDVDGSRSLLESVSPEGLYRAAIDGEFVRRWAVVINNLAEGASPRRELGFLAPTRSFTVVKRAGVTVIDPATYRRYDAFAAAVASVDARALAQVYRTLRGPLQAAHRILGYPRASLDGAVARALARIENAPIEDRDVAVDDDGGVFVFRDRHLEDLPGVEKHFLRMGPRNTRLVQAKAREIREALSLPRALGRTAASR